jgi:hypothetical protein
MTDHPLFTVATKAQQIACTLFVLLLPAPSLADGEQCPEAPADVTAETPDEQRLACSAVSDTIQMLGRCDISPIRPLKLQIMREVRHPLGGVVFGLLDTKRERVLIAHQMTIPALVKDTPYAKLPPRDFYRSLIVHETVHGIMHQNLKRTAESYAAYEYPAYALQIESLEQKARAEFLQSFDQAAIEAEFLFSDPFLFFDPYLFAARAYHHFKASTDACARLSALLEGRAAFIAPSGM